MTYRDEAGAILLTFGVATAGALLFAALHMPAPWLIGSMIAVAAFTFSGLHVALPNSFRTVLFIVTGVSMGSGFTPETASGLIKWPASLTALMIAVALMVVASIAFLVRYAKWNRATAFFASVPGALSAVLLFAMRSDADVKLVALAQLFRLFVLMAVLPIVVIVSVPHGDLTAPAAQVSSYQQVALEMLAGAALGFALERLRFSGGLIIGGLTASAAIHASGTFTGQMPNGVLIPCQIALGAFVGERFRNMDLALLKSALMPAAGSFLIAVVTSGGAALAVAWALNLPAGMVLIAFAPGALEAMAMLAFAFGLDPAFVGVHQLARFLILSLMIPIVAKVYADKPE